MNVRDSFRVRDICFIALGAAIYAFGFVYFYMANQIAANGLAGLTLVFHALIVMEVSQMAVVFFATTEEVFLRLIPMI